MLKTELHAHTADDPIDRVPHSTIELIDRASALGSASATDKRADLGATVEWMKDIVYLDPIQSCS